jgi:hypothetical protein
VTPDYYHERIAYNLRHMFFAIQAVAPGMIAAGGGAIVNLSSNSWREAAGSMPVYTSAKAAVHGMTRAFARAPRTPPHPGQYGNCHAHRRCVRARSCSKRPRLTSTWRGWTRWSTCPRTTTSPDWARSSTVGRAVREARQRKLLRADRRHPGVRPSAQRARGASALGCRCGCGNDRTPPALKRRYRVPAAS